MAFTITPAETRTQSMTDNFTGECQSVTDFLPGSKIRTKFETIAVEMESQDLSFYTAARKAIPSGIYQAFGFSQIPAVVATGYVTFTKQSTPSVTIPAGTKVSTDSKIGIKKVYMTSAELIIGVGQTSASVQVFCLAAGAIGNTEINTITVMETWISNIYSVTNAAAFRSGSDIENENDRRLRFQSYVSSLARGTITAVEYAAKLATIVDTNGNVVERVTYSKVVEPYLTDNALPVGLYDCFIFNGESNTSSDLVARAQTIINGYEDQFGNKTPGYVAAGVICTVKKATEVAISVTASIAVDPTYDAEAVRTEVVAAITRYVQLLGVSENYIQAKTIEVIMSIAGVKNCTVTLPTADMSQSISMVFIPGTITVTVQ